MPTLSISPYKLCSFSERFIFVLDYKYALVARNTVKRLDLKTEQWQDMPSLNRNPFTTSISCCSTKDAIYAFHGNFIEKLNDPGTINVKSMNPWELIQISISPFASSGQIQTLNSQELILLKVDFDFYGNHKLMHAKTFNIFTKQMTP